MGKKHAHIPLRSGRALNIMMTVLLLSIAVELLLMILELRNKCTIGGASNKKNSQRMQNLNSTTVQIPAQWSVAKS